MSFLVTAAGHSGTMFLATQLNKAPGWIVKHEPDGCMIPEHVSHRFAVPQYGEVNSWLLCSARHIPAQHKAILIRNPYDILGSVLRDGHASKSPDSAVMYVQGAITVLDSLARDGLPVIRFSEIINSPKAILDAALTVGIDSLTEEMVDTDVLNHHEGESIEVELSAETRSDFDYFIDTWM